MSKFLDKTGLDTLWAKIKSTFQTLGNLVTSVRATSSASNDKYPSEKAVASALDGKATKIEFTQPAEYKSFVIIEDITRWYDPAGTAAISKGYQLIGQIAYWRSGGGYESMAVAFIKFHLNYRWQLTNGSCCEVKSTLPSNSFCPMIIRDARDENNVKYYFGLRTKIAWNSTVQFIGRTRDLSFSNLEWIPGENATHTGNGTEFPVGITIEKNCDLLEWNSIANGGTGATTAIEAEYNILNQVADGTPSSLDDDRKIALCNQTKSASNGVFRWTKLSYFWTYFKDKISSVLGLSESNGVKTFTGNAATATTATTAAGYTSGGAIDTALQGKATPADIASAIQALDVASQGGDGKYIKAISEADGKISAKAETMDTAPTANSTKAVTSGGVKTALDGKVNKDGDKGLSTNDYTTAEKNKLAGIAEGAEPNVQSDWNQATTTADDYIKNKPTVSRYFNKYSGNTSVYGWKIGSTVTRNSEGASSIITGVFTLALGIRGENAPQESTAVKTMATMVGFFSCFARYESGANEVKARIYTPVSSIFNATYNLKYIDEGNGKFTWVLGFGTGTTPISKNFVHCSVNVMSSINADFENFGDAITSSPTYGKYFTVFKSPVIGQNTSGVGDATNPAYVDTNGFMKACTSVNADTVDGFHFSTSTSGSATNTVYLV